MTVEKVDVIPKRTGVDSSENSLPRSTFSIMRRRINIIMDANVKYGKLIFTPDEYSSSKIAYQSLRKHAIDNDFPIKFVVRNGNLYFTRLDME